MNDKPQPATSQDSGFVIEDRSSGVPVYYDLATVVPGTFAWTQDKHKSTVLRFARKSDGERFIEKFMPHTLPDAMAVPL